MRPIRLLAIGGSDSSGGAGIQADIKTASAFGAYAMSAITAVTAQDTTSIGAIHIIPTPVVCEQIRRCLGDIGADAIKIGMLGSATTAKAVADILATCAKDVPVVTDPVMVATSGAFLADDDTVGVLKANLFAASALITPNLPEAQRLCGFALRRPEDLLQAGKALLATGAKAVLIKGGHGEGNALVDLLFCDQQQPRAYTARRRLSAHTHGTGCTLATAIACGLAQGLALADAIQRAHDFVQKAIWSAPGLGAGNGPINHLA